MIKLKKNEKLKILFVGVPDMGLVSLKALVEAGQNIIAVVPPVPEHPCHNLMVNTAAGYGISSVYFRQSPYELDFLKKIKSLNPDIGIVCSFDHLLPKDFFSIPKYGTINSHPSLLPDYRGGNPLFHVINNNEKFTGVTLHYMDEKFDTGNIIKQWKTAITPDETMGTLFNRLNEKTNEMLIEVLDELETNKKLDSYEQDCCSSYKKAPKLILEKGHNVIDWGADAHSIERFVRACNPFFGALCYFRGNFVRIWSGRYSQTIDVSNANPGSIISVSEDNLLISTQKGVFMPEVMQLGSYFTGSVRDFIRRTSPKAGEVFLGRY